MNKLLVYLLLYFLILRFIKSKKSEYFSEEGLPTLEEALTEEEEATINEPRFDVLQQIQEKPPEKKSCSSSLYELVLENGEKDITSELTISGNTWEVIKQGSSVSGVMTQYEVVDLGFSGPPRTSSNYALKITKMGMNNFFGVNVLVKAHKPIVVSMWFMPLILIPNDTPSDTFGFRINKPIVTTKQDFVNQLEVNKWKKITATFIYDMDTYDDIQFVFDGLQDGTQFMITDFKVLMIEE